MLTNPQRNPNDNSPNFRSSISPLGNNLEVSIQKLCQHFISEDLLQDDSALYIPARGGYTPYTTQTFDLDQMVGTFLQSEKKVLLLLGESGSGKTLYGQTLVMNAARQYLQLQREDYFPIPLFISLPSLRNPQQTLMEETLVQHHLSHLEEDLKTKKFLFILDAYDELHLQKNLYIANRLDQWNAKIIITCRSSYLTNIPNYQQYFIPFKGEKSQAFLLQEVYMAPFSTEQIVTYIQQYLQAKQKEISEKLEWRTSDKEWFEANTYETWINQIPGLRPLVQTPFLLKITMEVLPEVVEQFKQAEFQQEYFKITGVKLYDIFVERWFGRQEERLIGLNQHPGYSLQADYMTFAKALATKMFELNLSQVTYEESSSIFEKGSESEWAKFFSNKLVSTDEKDTNRKDARILARKACPLRKVGTNQYAFLHTSLLEYFYSRDLIDKEKAYQAQQKPTIPLTQTLKMEQTTNLVPQYLNDNSSSNHISLLTAFKQTTNPSPIRTYSIADSKIPIFSDSWVVSLMRKPYGNNPDHAILVIEGLDEFGKGSIYRYDLFEDNNNPGYAFVKGQVLTAIPLNEIKDKLCRELMKQETFYSKSWSISKTQALNLIKDIEQDKDKKIKYCISGKNSVYVKSMSEEAHSCFTWAREKLYNLDDPRIKKDVPEKWTELGAAVTRFYIDGPKGEKEGCLMM